MTQQKRTLTIREMSTIAILSAIAAVLFMLEIPIVAFYKLDFSNLPVLLCTFAMGPFAGTICLFIKSALGLLHSTSQGVGELADFIMGLAMILPAGLIYRRSKSRKSALIGMIVGSLCATAAGVLTNLYLLIPFYGAVYNMPVEAILAMGQKVIPSLDSLWKFALCITAPFNLLKWCAISLLGYLMYKPLSPLLHGKRAGVTKRA